MATLDPLFYALIEDDPKNWNLKKIQILHTTIEQLAHHGVMETSFDTIAKKLEISRSHISYYFDSKEMLYLEAIRFVAATAQKITVERVKKNAPKEAVLSVVHGAFDWAERFPDQAKIMVLFYHFCTFDEKYKKFNARLRIEGIGRIQLLLGKARGREALAREIQALITGYLVEAFCADSESLEEARQSCIHSVSQLL